MLGILKTLKDRTDVSRLRRRGRVDTRPGSTVELCQRLLRHGRIDAALAAAREGLERFPHSERLKEVVRHAWRQLKGREIDALRRRCDVSGNVDDVLGLARLLRDCGDEDQALIALESLHCRDELPLEALLMEGEILLGRFFRDRVAQDARQGAARLQRALEQSPGAFRPHLLLARLYCRIGAVSKGLFHVYRALDIDSEAAEARELYEELAALPLEVKDEATLLREIEESEEAGTCAPSAPVAPAQRAEIVAGIVRLSQLNGVARVSFADAGLTLVAANGDCRVLPEAEVDPLCAIATGFRKAASISAKRMGIGAFHVAELAAGDRVLLFQAVGRGVILIEVSGAGRVAVAREECSSFVAASLRRRTEAVDA